MVERMGKRELVALLSLSSWCLMIVVWLFLAVPWVCLQFVIVVFPDHTHCFFELDQLQHEDCLVSNQDFHSICFMLSAEDTFFPCQPSSTTHGATKVADIIYLVF